MRRSKAEDQAQLLAWRRAVVRSHTWLGRRFDQAAWVIANQREPWKWSWPRTFMYLVVLLAPSIALVLIADFQGTLPVGLAAVWTLYVGRARVLHLRYIEEHAGAAAFPE